MGRCNSGPAMQRFGHCTPQDARTQLWARSVSFKGPHGSAEEPACCGSSKKTGEFAVFHRTMVQFWSFLAL